MIQLTDQFKEPLDALRRIYAGTLKSLQDRVLPNGFCHTSYGEENGVKCYGEVHYPRDAAEAARVLALTDDSEKALSILEFTLKSIPENQRHIPHVLGVDGSILRNTIQIDTPAHNVLALEALWHSFCLEPERLRSVCTRLARLAEWIWEDHFHPQWNLLDAGNYNEQGFGGSSEAIMDMFTNASCHAMYTALAKMTGEMGLDAQASTFRDYASFLERGISENLLNPENGMYFQARHLSDGRPEGDVNWLSLYPVRWFLPDDITPYRLAYDYLWEHTCNDWNGRLIPSGEKPDLSFRTMGKHLAVLLGFAAAINDTPRLERLLEFIQETVRRPDNLWPEFWYHHPHDNDYYRWLFDEQFPGVWSPFTENPDGDYTVDSGNCEQSAVFCQIFLNFFS